MTTVHRNEWQTMSETRLREAQALLIAGEPSGAYYLAGYAVECGLKACISRQFLADTVPDRKMVLSVFQHDLEKLVNLAGLESARQSEAQVDSDFEANWALIKDWDEQSRYSTFQPVEATDLISAVADPQHGVLRWVRTHW